VRRGGHRRRSRVHAGARRARNRQRLRTQRSFVSPCRDRFGRRARSPGTRILGFFFRISSVRGTSARVRFFTRSLGIAAAFLLAPRVAHADVSSWLFVGGGQSWTSSSEESTQRNLLFQLDAGIGTPPSDAIIFGGLFRTQTHFGQGTDLGLFLRVATNGYV